jgi:hypothetical protein
MVEIRHATQADQAELLRLAQRDSARVPRGRLIVAATDGRLLAALSLDTGEGVADPFRPTANVLEALRAFAAPRARPARSRRARTARAAAAAAQTATA